MGIECGRLLLGGQALAVAGETPGSPLVSFASKNPGYRVAVPLLDLPHILHADMQLLQHSSYFPASLQ